MKKNESFFNLESLKSNFPKGDVNKNFDEIYLQRFTQNPKINKILELVTNPGNLIKLLVKPLKSGVTLATVRVNDFSSKLLSKFSTDLNGLKKLEINTLTKPLNALSNPFKAITKPLKGVKDISSTVLQTDAFGFEDLKQGLNIASIEGTNLGFDTSKVLDLNPKFNEVFNEVESNFNPNMLEEKIKNLASFNPLKNVSFLERSLFNQTSLFAKPSKSILPKKDRIENKTPSFVSQIAEKDNPLTQNNGLTKENIRQEIASEINIFASILRNKL